MKQLVIMFILLAVTAIFPHSLLADNVGGCGVGSKLFAGQRGIAPQVFAITTNGTFLNTFGVSTGTSGCTQDGVVHSNWKTAAFIDSNMNKLARDMSRGEGETLDSLAFLLDVETTDKEQFNQTLKENFTTIFSSEVVTTDLVRNNLVAVLHASENLTQYAAKV